MFEHTAIHFQIFRIINPGFTTALILLQYSIKTGLTLLQ